MNKLLILMVTLSFVAISCASKTEMTNDLEKRVENEQVRSLKEIKTHAKILIKTHPEIKENTRKEIKSLLNDFIDSHEKMRDKESKIVTLLLKKSINYEQLTKKEKKQKSMLRKKLRNLYTKKSKNVETFLDKIVDLHKENKINTDFQDDLIIFMRDWR